MKTIAPPNIYVVHKPKGSAYYLLGGALQYALLPRDGGEPLWDEGGEVDLERALESDEEREGFRQIERGLAAITLE